MTRGRDFARWFAAVLAALALLTAGSCEDTEQGPGGGERQEQEDGGNGGEQDGDQEDGGY
ncbi:hypothetical protein [Actinopolyspora xinjiangensis]|nr:hypothetical protein [Actinopolyspora xinjiangensis]